jgi:glycosyltransferase involved in cell wall biosynthesis
MAEVNPGTGGPIALFLPSMGPGGVQRDMINLAREFLERDLGVDMVLVRAHGPLLKEIPAGVRIVDLKARRALTSLPALVRYLHREHPAVMLASQPHNNMVALWVRRLALPRMRLFVSEHGHVSTALKYSRRLAERFFPILMRWFYPWADGIIAVSRGTADDLAQCAHLPPERIIVIPNPVVTPEMEALMQQPVTHPWFAPGSPPVILAIGRLHPAKDYPTLLRAFSLLRSSHPCRLLILGEGEQRPQLQSLCEQLQIASEVDLPGFEGNPFRYMQRCAVFALASAWEGFGNVLVEALACGATIVSTDCPGGPAEILECGKYGTLVPVGDPKALAQALEQALEHPLDPESLRRRAQDFTSQHVAGEYLRVMGISS